MKNHLRAVCLEVKIKDKIFCHLWFEVGCLVRNLPNRDSRQIDNEQGRGSHNSKDVEYMFCRTNDL